MLRVRVVLCAIFLVGHIHGGKKEVKEEKKVVNKDALTEALGLDKPTSILRNVIPRESLNNQLTPFYKMSTHFMDTVLQTNTLADLEKVKPGAASRLMAADFKYIEDNSDVFTTYFYGYVISIVFSLLLLTIMMIFPLTFCICRCRGVCVRTQSKAPNCSLEVIMAVLIVFLSAVALTFNVGAMAASARLHYFQAEAEVVDNVNYTALAVDEFISETLMDFEVFMFRTADESVDFALLQMEEILDTSFERLDNMTGAAAVLKHANAYFAKISDSLKIAKQNLAKLKDGLKKAKNDIAEVTEKTKATSECQSNPVCVKAMNVSSPVTYHQIDGKILEEPHGMTSKARDRFQETYNTYMTMKADIREQVDKDLVSTEEAVVEVTIEIQTVVNETRDFARSIDMKAVVAKAEDVQSEYFAPYGNGIVYGLVIVGALTIPVALMYIIGLSVWKCRGKEVADSIIITGVYHFLAVSIFLQLVSIPLVLVGGFLHTEFCRYVAQPERYKESLEVAFRGVDNHIPKFNIVDIMRGCELNQSIFTAMNGDNYVNLADKTDLSNKKFRRKLDKLGSLNFTAEHVEFVDGELVKAFNDMNKSLDTIMYSHFEQQSKMPLIQGDLVALATFLKSAGKTDDAAKTETIHKTTLPELEKLRTEMDAELRVVKNSLSHDEMGDVKKELKWSEKEINEKTRAMVRQSLAAIGQRVFSVLDQGATDIEAGIRNKIGPCRKMYDVTFQTLRNLCVGFLKPLNVYWFSIGINFFCYFWSMFAVFILERAMGHTPEFEPVENEKDCYSNDRYSRPY